MSEYTPDKWAILVVFDATGKATYKILASWKGGYLSGDSWKLNSGIEEVRRNGVFFEIYGFSGSLYRCNKNAYGTTAYSFEIFHSLRRSAENNGEYSMRILSGGEAITWLEEKIK